MPTYRVTGPDGKRYDVTAPEGATDKDAIAYIAQTKYGYGSPEKQEDQGFFGNVGQLLKSGYEQAKAAVEVSPGLAGADMTQKAGTIAGALEAQRRAPEPEQLRKAKGAFKEEAEMIEEAPHWYSPGALGGAALSVVELGKQMLTNPKGAAYMFAEQAANMAPGIAGMIAGGAAGSAVAPVIGTAVGAVGGGFAGQAPVEAGSEFISLIGQELARRELDPTEANVARLLSDKKFLEKASSEARIKGVTTAAVDAVTTVAGGRLASGAERAAIKAAKAELGAAATEAQIAARVSSLLESRTLAQRAGRGAAGVGLDVAGGGASEAAGQYAAYGKIDPESVMQEMMGELAGAGIEVPAAAKAVAKKVLPRGAELTPEQRTQADIEKLDKNIAYYDSLIPERQAEAEEVQQRAADEARDLTREEQGIVEDFENVQNMRAEATAAREKLITPEAPPVEAVPAEAPQQPDIRQQAIEVMQTANNTGAPAIQKGLGLKNLSEAKKIRDSLIDDGTLVLAEDGTYKLAEIPSAGISTTATQGVEQGAAGRGAVEPVSGEGAGVAGTSESGIEGLAGTGVPSAELNAGEAGVEGALNPELQAAKDFIDKIDQGGVPLNAAIPNKIARDLGLEVSKNAKPEETIQRIRDAVARGTSIPPIKATPTEAIAPTEDIAPAQPAAAETQAAAPLTPERQQASDRIVQLNSRMAALTNVINKMPEGEEKTNASSAIYSLGKSREAIAKQYGLDKDGRPVEAAVPTTAPAAQAQTTQAQTTQAQTTQAQTTQAPTAAPTTAAPSPTSVAALRHQQARQAHQALNQNRNRLPQFNNKILNKAMEFLTGERSVQLKRLFLSGLSLRQMAQLYQRKNPALAAIFRVADTAIGSYRSEYAAGEKRIKDNLERWGKIFGKRTQQEREEFGDIVHTSTREDLDVTSALADSLLNRINSGAVKRNQLNKYDSDLYALTTRFRNLHPDLRSIYTPLRAEYIRYSNQFFKQLEAMIGSSLAAKVRKEYESNRIMVYFPLFRQPGDFWLSYQDANNNKVTRSFDNKFDRDRAQAAAEQDPANSNVTPFSRIEAYDYNTNAPPTGFMTDIITEMKNSNVDKAVIDMVYETFLDHLPNSSIRHMFREREGDLGYVGDPLIAYANVASKLNRHILNMKYNRRFQAVLAQATEAVGGRKTPSNDERLAVEALRNTLNDASSSNYGLLDKVGTVVYYFTMAANVSTAFFNLFTLPMFTGAILAGKYGDARAMAAMTAATRDYYKYGGIQAGSTSTISWLPDYTFGAKAQGEERILFNALMKQGVLHSAQNFDMREAQKSGVSDYVGKIEKGKRLANWALHNSERATREITALATFKLARDSGKSVEEAINEAIETINDTHGYSNPEAGPTLFRSGLPRMAFMLKRFSHAALWLNVRLLREALRFSHADKDTARVARRQLLRILGATFLFAGARGLPVYGAYTVAASLFGWLASSMGFGDDDEPKDPDADARATLGDTAYYGLLNELTGLDVSSRVSLSDLVWRDDSDRLEDVGPFLYVAERLFGPAGSLAQNAWRGAGLLKEGHTERALEAMTPAAMRNMLKAFRYATEDARTKNGDKLISNVSDYQSFMQIFGVAPTDVQKANERAGEKYRADKQLRERRKSLYDAAYAAYLSGDAEAMREIEQEQRDFSIKNPAYAIPPNSTMRSIQDREENAAKSVDGLYIPEKRAYQLERQGVGRER